jgi:hypothetical protein
VAARRIAQGAFQNPRRVNGTNPSKTMSAVGKSGIRPTKKGAVDIQHEIMIWRKLAVARFAAPAL